jgi:hypothetical protein
MRFDSILICYLLFYFKHSYPSPSHLSHCIMAFLFKQSTEVCKSAIFLGYNNTMNDRNIDFVLVCQDRLAQSIALHSPGMENS